MYKIFFLKIPGFLCAINNKKWQTLKTFLLNSGLILNLPKVLLSRIK